MTLPTTYVAIFARMNGRIGSEVGREIVELYEGEPLNEMNFYGERYARISNLDHNEVHYIATEDLITR
ncbi:hypothetical protein [Microbacterium sp. zg-YB36]|uniref:hypothetical protein n=1 Tax=Microbacterium sp. zg-YB36 TaxID=2969407 RepID=UPI00214B0A78|nr:hypothetical protein [Microbacterium sp. zg-YB36]MDL5351059.1 hypothetical protein [Microbacterium sp. zg-YB36]